ncbi:LuxR C-terminal-related transcriptional regulator [Nocardia testacea]|uniref:helix-turn-helix transcriptional regulator n=1 Tax=Nocardia testacea TaxID=248551 RepID=UPI003A853250
MTIDSREQTIDAVLNLRIRQMQQIVGLPVVFGGAVSRTAGQSRLKISHLRGTISDSLAELSVLHGRGVGGETLARGTPCRVDNYATTTEFTHDYMSQVVERERLISVFALPIRVRGSIAAVVYGASRSAQPIGDAALERAGAFAVQLERELDDLLAVPVPPAGCSTGDSARVALKQLTDIARTTPDPNLRMRLQRIAAGLAAAVAEADAPGSGPGPAIHLAPRELEVLQLVSVGMSNSAAAEVMGLGVETVKAYLRSAMRRLGVHNRTAAVHAARSTGLL